MGETTPTPTAAGTGLQAPAARAHGLGWASRPHSALVVAWLFVALSERTAHAERDVVRLAHKSVAFEWQAPPECPSRGAVLERVERLVGHSAEPTSAIDAAIEARVERLESGEWQLGFDSSGGTAAERRVFGQSCDEVADAAALLVALLVDPLVASRTAGTTAVPAESTAAPVVEARLAQPAATEGVPARTGASAPSSRDAIAAPVAVSNRGRNPSVEVAAELAVVAGPLPRVAPGASMAVGMRFERLRLAARVAYFPEQGTNVPGSANGAEIGFGSGGVLFGYRALRGSVELAPFLAADLGWLHGHRSADTELAGSVLLVGLGPGLLSNYSISRDVLLQARIQVEVVAARPGFVVGSERVHRPGAAALEIGFGALWVTDSSR